MSSAPRTDVTVTFAGSGDAFGSGGRCQACIVVRAGQLPPILLDCGATSLVALKREGIDPNTVAAVAVSHLHIDHYGGLPQLILDGQFRRRVAPLTVAGPAGTAERLVAALEVMFPGSSTVRRRFDVNVIELQPGPVSTTIEHAIVRAVEVDHGMPGNVSSGCASTSRASRSPTAVTPHGPTPSLTWPLAAASSWPSSSLGQTSALPPTPCRPRRVSRPAGQPADHPHPHVRRHARPCTRSRIRTRI